MQFLSMGRMKTKVAVILSGCGVYDGAEIQESVLTLLALAKAGAEVSCIAPDIAQRHVIDHATGEELEDEDRNVMTEAARISRGEILPFDNVRAENFDAFIYVGGFGVAKNLSSYAFDGSDYDVDPAVIDLIQSAHEAGKAQGFMCIAPVLAARALGAQHVQLTIGNDSDAATAIEAKGARHLACKVDSIVVDEANRVVSTPAYMLAKSITEAEAGINQLVNAVLKFC
ncbi:isoprenoid biosynthesis glyoxalase ElbB [Coraliomargarita sp. SDUM461003]|uniref:Isoprenoid biosynthesis glyoxalase ElbB n=2 Tax=Thalassobacterium maritimum TaxID=3041265 RepID=A0ABU1ASJ9_9BACT|nr:isoprenoid biosynthesis glyoxalase ElbB [Coraliomargarita sp. SDUM461003]MDQ8207134.1 isoprenoid biosynthesis glyoxalase ElbB [Coraliomargarita sp. SDUM461003]